MIDSILLFFIVVSLGIVLYGVVQLSIIKYKFYRFVQRVFNVSEENTLVEISENKRIEEFKLKLSQAGVSQKQFIEIIFASILAGLSLIFLLFIVEFSPLFEILIVIIAIGTMLVAPFLYIDEQRKARIKRIDRDLAVFIDLLIIVLEGGGGLNNALDKVTHDGVGVMGRDLLEEATFFKNEVVNYGNEVACKNMATRTGSTALASIAGFILLSEETGIGVKSIFENQAQEIKQEEMISIEKKAATMNIKITLVMFLFILPAVIMMVAFPMSANVLWPAF